MRERVIAFGLFQLALLAILSASSFAQDFKPYPGSRLEEKPSQQPSAVDKEMEVQVYTTGDSFEKVYSFYKSLYKEVAIPFPKQTLPNRREVQWVVSTDERGTPTCHPKY